MNFTPQEQLTPFQMYFNCIRRALSGPLFLALTILLTCTSAFYFISFFLAPAALIGNLISLVILTLTTVGCWLAYVKARANDDFSAQFGLMRVYPIFNLVIYYIGAAGLALLTLIMALASGFWDEIVKELQKVLANESLSADAKQLLDLLNEGGSMIYALLLIFCIVGLACMILSIIRQTKFLGIIKHTAASFTTGRIPKLKTGFYTVMTYVIVTFELIRLILSARTSSPITILQNACTIAIMLLPVLIISQIKKEAAHLITLEQSEIQL